MSSKNSVDQQMLKTRAKNKIRAEMLKNSGDQNEIMHHFFHKVREKVTNANSSSSGHRAQGINKASTVKADSVIGHERLTTEPFLKSIDTESSTDRKTVIQCIRESLIYRGLPLAILSMFAVSACGARKAFKPKIPWYLGAGFTGLAAGPISYCGSFRTYLVPSNGWKPR